MIKRKVKSGLVGVDIGSTSIKKVEMALVGGVATITSVALEPLPQGAFIDKEIENPSQILSRLKKMRLAKARVALSVPDTQSAIHQSEINPPLIPSEVKQRALVDAEKLAPYSVAEMTYDYTYEDDILRIATFRKSKAKILSDVFEEADISAKVITPQSFAIEKVLPFILDDGKDNHTEATALFDIGYASAMLYVVKDGKVVYTRSSDFGSLNLERKIQEQHPNETIKSAQLRFSDNKEFNETIMQPFFESLASSLKQSLQLYASSNFTSIEVTSVLMTGGISAINELPSFLTGKLEMPVTAVNPFEKFPLASGLDTSSIETNHTSYLTAIGLSLCKVGEVINFQPWRDEREVEMKREYITTSVLVSIFGGALAMSVWLFANQTGLSQTEANNRVIKQIQTVDDRIKELQNVTQERNDMLAQMDLVHSFEADRPISVAILNTILKAVPSNVYLTEITRSGSTFTFVGKAQDSRSVANFMIALRNGGWFDNEFLSSFQAVDADSNIVANSLKQLEFPEHNYGQFTVTAELQMDFIKKDLVKQNQEIQETQKMISQNAPMSIQPASEVVSSSLNGVPQNDQSINENDARSKVGQFTQ